MPRSIAPRKSIAAKLILVASFALLTLLALAVAAFLFAGSSHRTADRVYEDGFLELVTATRLASAVENHRRIVESAPAEVDRKILNVEREQLEKLNALIEALLAESHVAASSPATPSQSIARDVALMIHLGMRTNDYATSFAIDMAKESVAEYNTYARRVSQHIADYRAERVKLAERAFRALKLEAVRLIVLVTACFGITLLIIAPLGAVVVRGMLVRLTQIHDAITELSRGNLAIHVPFSGDRDEVGELARALNVLHTNAKALVDHKSALAQRNEELAQLSSTLELRVAERTAEAQEAVARASQINTRLLAEIDAKNRIEDHLRAANKELLSATRTKSQFLANVSHEIRTPIMGVIGMSDLLLKGSLAKPQRHFAETIAKSAEILLSIVNDILDLSRMDAGKLTLDVHDFVVDGFVEDVVQVSAAAAANKKLRLHSIIDTDVPRTLEGDSVRLRQVLLNLVSNAIKFTAAGGVTVRVGVESAPSSRLVIRVRDTGIGIAKSQQSQLFNAFSQADPSITRKFGGTGLGLVICKKLIEMMDGTIAIDSDTGVGTEVVIRIPLTVSKDGSGKGEPTKLSLDGKRIVIVADDELGREGLCCRLGRLGATAVALPPADAAATALLDPSIDCFEAVIVMTDNADADGRRIAAALSGKTSGAGRPVRVFAAMASPLPEAAADDAVQYLPWPALSRDIVSAITAHRAEPLVQSQAQTAALASLALMRGGIAPKVLVAEDNPIIQEVIIEYLAALGCQATVVDNGLAAVQSYGSAAFDVVLLDCQMPIMDGYMAARRLRQIERDERRPRLPIVAITANTFESDRQKCVASGMGTILSKPFTQEELANVLKAQLDPSATTAVRADPQTSPPEQSPCVTSAMSASRPTPPARRDADIAQASSLRVVDADAIATHRTRNPRLLQRMIELYGNHSPQTVAELQRALAQNDWASVKAAAHTLKSSSQGLGLERLASLLAILELHARGLAEDASPSCDPAATAELAALVVREADVALGELEGYREQPRRDAG